MVETSAGAAKNRDVSIWVACRRNRQGFLEICIVLIGRMDDIGAGCQQVSAFIRAEGIKVSGDERRYDFVTEKVACPAIDSVDDVGIHDSLEEEILRPAGKLAVRSHHNSSDIHAHTIQVYPDGPSLFVSWPVFALVTDRRLPRFPLSKPYALIAQFNA